MLSLAKSAFKLWLIKYCIHKVFGNVSQYLISNFHFQVSNIGLDDIGNKIRPLLQLKVLDLSKNQLTDLPEYLGNLPLSDLNLSHNQLSYKSNWSWLKRPCIQKNLNKLVLSHNKVNHISKWKIKLWLHMIAPLAVKNCPVY